MENLHALVSQNAVMVSTIILIVAYIFIAWEKISKVTIALLGGSLTLFLGLLATEKTHENLAQYFTSFLHIDRGLGVLLPRHMGNDHRVFPLDRRPVWRQEKIRSHSRRTQDGLAFDYGHIAAGCCFTF